MAKLAAELAGPLGLSYCPRGHENSDLKMWSLDSRSERRLQALKSFNPFDFAFRGLCKVTAVGQNPIYSNYLRFWGCLANKMG